MSINPVPLPSRFAAPSLAMAVCLGLAACANPRAELAHAARSELVGMPKETLLSCAGVPERTASMDNLDFFTYTSRSTAAYPSTTLGLHAGRYWYPGWGYGFGVPVTTYDVWSQACEATFTLRNGRVERVVYAGSPGGTGRLSQCYAIVENCLTLRPAPAGSASP